jgi:hypothetical protein
MKVNPAKAMRPCKGFSRIEYCLFALSPLPLKKQIPKKM